MDYVYDPEVAATIAAYVNYISPVKGVKEILEKTDPKHRQEPADLPDPTRSATKLHTYPAPRPDEERAGRCFQQAIGA